MRIPKETRDKKLLDCGHTPQPHANRKVVKTTRAGTKTVSTIQICKRCFEREFNYLDEEIVADGKECFSFTCDNCEKKKTRHTLTKTDHGETNRKFVWKSVECCGAVVVFEVMNI